MDATLLFRGRDKGATGRFDGDEYERQLRQLVASDEDNEDNYLSTIIVNFKPTIIDNYNQQLTSIFLKQEYAFREGYKNN